MPIRSLLVLCSFALVRTALGGEPHIVLDARYYVAGFDQCLRTLGRIGDSRDRSIDFASKLNEYFNFTGPHAYHEREVQVLTTSADNSLFVFSLNAKRFRPMTGQPTDERIVVFNAQNNQWTMVGSGAHDPYRREYEWVPSSGGPLLAIRHIFDPSGAVAPGTEGSSTTVLFNPRNGKQIGSRSVPNTAWKAPFVASNGKPVGDGSVVWLASNAAFLEFEADRVTLVRVGASGFESVRSVSYAEALKMKKDSLQGREIFGDPELNEIRAGLTQLQIPK